MIHGVMSRGSGLEKLTEDCRSDPTFPEEKHRVKLYDHGWTWPWEIMSRGSKVKLRDAIGGYIHKQKRKYPNCNNWNIVAHSYGTWGISHYLKKISPSDFSINNLFLLNSVVEKDFDWQGLINTDQVDQIINAGGVNDPVPVLGPAVGLGASGDYLFSSWFADTVGFDQDLSQIFNLFMEGGHSWIKQDNHRNLLRTVLAQTCKHANGDAVIDNATLR